jgi:hypothetical protein
MSSQSNLLAGSMQQHLESPTPGQEQTLGTYWYLLVYTNTYQNEQVCPGTYWYVLVCTSMVYTRDILLYTSADQQYNGIYVYQYMYHVYHDIYLIYTLIYQVYHGHFPCPVIWKGSRVL